MSGVKAGEEARMEDGGDGVIRGAAGCCAADRAAQTQPSYRSA